MMKTDKDFEFDTPPSSDISEYILSVSDVFEYQLYTNDGTSIIDITAVSGTGNAARGAFKSGETYLIEQDGFAKLPVLGRLKLEGYTIKEAESFLEKKYEKYYVNSFIRLNVLNRRITVFPGGSSQAKVIPLENENTTMLEALALVGGLPKEAKAYKIKLIRGDLKNPKVYLFDFTTIEGIKQADFVLQANDMIYVEKRNDAFRELVRDIAPIVSLVTSTITLIVVINSLK